MKDDKVYLRHIQDAIGHIDDFIKDCEEKDFEKNVLVHSAVIRQLEIIGEAVKSLSSDLRRKYKHIPWRDIAGLRDKLIHEYFGVDHALV